MECSELGSILSLERLVEIFNIKAFLLPEVLTHAGALQFGSDVNSMTVKTEAWHCHTDYRCHYWACNHNIAKDSGIPD